MTMIKVLLACLVVIFGNLPLEGAEAPGPTVLFTQKVAAESEWAKGFIGQFTEKNIAKACPDDKMGSYYPCYLKQYREAVKKRNPTETGLVLLFTQGVQVIAADARANGMNKKTSPGFPPWQQIWFVEWSATGLEDQLRIYEGLPAHPPNKEEQLLKEFRQTVIKKFVAQLDQKQSENLAKTRSRPDIASDSTGKLAQHLAEVDRRMEAIHKRMPPK